jgi:hypothetical protein
MGDAPMKRSTSAQNSPAWKRALDELEELIRMELEECKHILEEAGDG